MDTIITVATLALLLGALLIFDRARKEASAEREAAREESERLRDDAKRLFEQAHAEAVEAEHAAAALAAERAAYDSQVASRLAELAGLTPAEAKAELVAKLRASAKAEVAREEHLLIKRARDGAEARARQILVDAMEHLSGPVSAQGSVTRVELPSDEMRGRIIGREGRNIRAFEALTGVNVIVDEGVNAVLVSSFDVQRREVAVAALEALIADGRIQPHRVEEAYRRALAEAEERGREAAMDAIERAGVGAVQAELVDLLGACRLRTSYGQNVLDHLVETAQIAASIAAQVGADADLARRAGLLHDVGKVLTATQPGTHAALGARAAAAAGEAPAVVNAIAAHHDEVPQDSLEAVIVQIADAISAARPGARREEAERYVERMASLEALVLQQPGVDHVYAMAAGRELRVVVRPDAVSDEQMAVLARTLAEHIEADTAFSGEIRVTVIRETRADVVAGQA